MSDQLKAIIANTPDKTFEMAGGFDYTDEIAVGLEDRWKDHPTGSPVLVSQMDLCWLLEGYARARLAAIAAKKQANYYEWQIYPESMGR